MLIFELNMKTYRLHQKESLNQLLVGQGIRKVLKNRSDLLLYRRKRKLLFDPSILSQRLAVFP